MQESNERAPQKSKTNKKPEKKRGRPPRGSDRALSRDRILETALKASKVDGLEKLSIRRLAKELGVNSASIYWHFPNRKALILAALDHASQEIDLSLPPKKGPWQERSLSFCHQIRTQISKHPEVLQIQDQGSILTPFVVHASRTLMEILSVTGLRGEPLLLAAETLLWQALGMTRIEVGLRDGLPSSEMVTEINQIAVPTSTEGLQVEEWRSVAKAYLGLDHKKFFDFAIRTTLDGIEHSLRD